MHGVQVCLEPRDANIRQPFAYFSTAAKLLDWRLSCSNYDEHLCSVSNLTSQIPWDIGFKGHMVPCLDLNHSFTSIRVLLSACISDNY